jgi:hypothetical protein
MLALLAITYLRFPSHDQGAKESLMAAVVSSPYPEIESKRARITQNPGSGVCPSFKCSCRTYLNCCAESANQDDPQSNHNHKIKQGFQVPSSTTVAAIRSDTLQTKKAVGTGLVNQESPRKIIFQQLHCPVPPISHPQALDLAGLLSKAGESPGVRNMQPLNSKLYCAVSLIC